MKALIIEDEILASRHLKQILAEAGDIYVIDTLESIAETIEWFASNTQPDIVFMDIHLADGIAFEIFNHVSINCPVIFTTAYDEYALRAFKVNSVDYLLKPINPEELKNAIEKFLQTSQPVPAINPQELLKLLNKQNQNYTSRFLVKIGAHFKMIKVEDIACFYSMNKGTYLKTMDNRDYDINYTLDQLENMINPDDFYRVNRQYIISAGAIKDILVYSNSRLKINAFVKTDEDVIVSRDRVADFKNWLEK